MPPLILIQRADPRAPESEALLVALTRELAALYTDRGEDGGAGFDVAQVLVPRAAPDRMGRRIGPRLWRVAAVRR
jgi:hypothetical protein